MINTRRARDMARVARAVYFNPLLRDIIKDSALHVPLRERKDDSPAKHEPVLRTVLLLQRNENRLYGRGGALPHFERLLERKGHDRRGPGGSKARVWQESAALLAYGLGIRETQLASLRVAPSAIPDDEE